MLPRPEKSTLRLAGVRTAAGLGRPLSAFAIGPSGDFEELADCWVGAYGLATAGAVPAGWTRLAQSRQFTGKLFTSFQGRKIPRLRGRRRSFGPPRSFHGLVAKASSAKKVAPARRPSRPGSARFSD